MTLTAAQEFQHRYFDMLTESQYWPEAVMVEYQRSQLEQLLTHARATAPFYENRLDPVFTRHGSIDWDRWGEIPILKRVDVMHHGGAILSRAPITGHGPMGEIATSGSTGHPITVRVTTLMDRMTRVCRWRADRWEGLDWSKTMLARLADNPQRPDGYLLGRWGPAWDESAQSGKAYHVNRLTSMDSLLDLIIELGPDYLLINPKMTQVLTELARRRGVRTPLEAILAFGEGVSQPDRDAAVAGFGARMIELYSSKEAGAIAHPCPEGKGLHVNSEAMLVEILDDDGRPVKAGEVGRVVLTPFASTAQPLIRYDQGDRAVAGARCICGRCLPVIESIAGRTNAIFRHPDGRLSARPLLPFSIRTLIGAGQLQVAQVGANSYEVRYVLQDTGATRDEAAFVANFRKVYFEDAEVTLVPLSEIPLTPAGKFIEYINEWTGGD